MVRNKKDFLHFQTKECWWLVMAFHKQGPAIRVFHANSPQYKNANLANFILVELGEQSLQLWNIILLHRKTFNFTFTYTILCKYMWEYNVGNNAYITNFVCSWKSRHSSKSPSSSRFWNYVGKHQVFYCVQNDYSSGWNLVI